MKDEINILETIADNQALLDALKRLLLDQFSLDDFTTNFTNENLGAQVRACLVAKEGIRNAFNYIEKYKPVENKPPIKNPAR